MATSSGDIMLNGKAYLLALPSGFGVEDAPKSRAVTNAANQGEFRAQDNYIYFGQSDYSGMGVDSFLDSYRGSAPYSDGWGLDLSTNGKMKVAPQLTQSFADTANPDGYVPFPVGTNKLVFMGKNDGRMIWTPDNGATWGTLATALGTVTYLGVAGTVVNARSWGYLKGYYYVTDQFGGLARTNNPPDSWTTGWTGLGYGPTLGAAGVDPYYGPAYILGTYKGKLWIGYNNRVFTYDGTTWVEFKAGEIDGHAICGAAGGNVLYFVTKGPQPQIYYTDGTNLFHSAQFVSDFTPRWVSYLETLYIGGGVTDDVNALGQVWKLTPSGVRPIFLFGSGSSVTDTLNGAINATVTSITVTSGASYATTGYVLQCEAERMLVTNRVGNVLTVARGYDSSVAASHANGTATIAGPDYGMRNAMVDNQKIYWTASQYSGVGVFDPSMDIVQDTQLGFYVSSVSSTTTAIVAGIVQSRSAIFVGFQGLGIYKQTTPGNFKITSSLFGAYSRGIQKLWGQAEVRTSPLLTGQSITMSTTKDASATVTAWGTASTLAQELSVITAPAQYKSPFLQFIISGNANAQALTLYSVQLGYVEASDTPKNDWRLYIELDGYVDSENGVSYMQDMRDGTKNTRTAITMFNELEALRGASSWSFEDPFGTTYQVVIRSRSFSPSNDVGRGQTDWWRKVTAGTVDLFSGVYTLHLVQL